MFASVTLVRWLLGVLCVFFAYYLGRSLARRIVERDTRAPVGRWGFRVLAAGLAYSWSGSEPVSVVLTMAGAALAAVLGFYHEKRPKKPEEDLSKLMFPKE
jgi:hypothetical protein